MVMKIPVQFARQAYQLASKTVSIQRCVNCYIEYNQDAKGVVTLYGTPGLLKKLTLPTSPVYGLHVMDGTLYAITRTKLYSISSAWVATELGDVTIAGHISAADNGTQLAFCDGTNGYLWDGTTLTTLTTTANWSPANTVTYQDQYLIFNNSGTGQFFISNLADGTIYTATDFATAEGAPDDTVAVISDHRELFLFGAETIEIWQNTGASDFPFERIQGAFIEHGCASGLSVAKADNTIFWLGDDRIVYRAAGYTPERISTFAIDTQIDGYSTINDAFGYTYSDSGHKFYVLTFPTESKTWVYDISTGMWHERSYWNGGEERHRGNCHAYAYNENVVGDYDTGEVYIYSDSTYTDDGDTIRRLAVAPPIHKDRDWLFMSEYEIEFESGVGLTSGQGSDPQAMIRYSDDGKTWSSELWRSIGKIGRYSDRAVWRRLGRFRFRYIELTVTDPIKFVVVGAFARLESGR